MCYRPPVFPGSFTVAHTPLRGHTGQEADVSARPNARAKVLFIVTDVWNGRAPSLDRAQMQAIYEEEGIGSDTSKPGFGKHLFLVFLTQKQRAIRDLRV